MELTLEEALQKGVEAHKAGKPQEADRYYTAILKAQPKHHDANHGMGLLAVDLGNIKAALPFFKTALEANPRITQFWISYLDALINLDRIADAKAVFGQAKSIGLNGNVFDQIEKRLGRLEKVAAVDDAYIKSQEPPQKQLQPSVDLHTLGQYQKALNQAQKLLTEYPSSATLYNIIGASNQGLDKLDEAMESYNKAISLNPNYAEVHYNMGNALKYQGKIDEAIKAYSKAISFKPDYAVAYNNMGNALINQGKIDEAIKAYHKTLSLKPDYAVAYKNVGNALKDQGKIDEAIKAYTKAISLKPDYVQAYHHLGIILKGKILTKPNRDLQHKIISILDSGLHVRPSEISAAAISLLKFESKLKKQIQLVDKEIIQNPLDVISELNGLPLLLKLMIVCPIFDLELERLLRSLRYGIIETISSIDEASPELLSFQSSLALQCFINEYIYSHTENEEKIVQLLEASVKKDLENNEQPKPESVLALASYKALHHYEWYNLLDVTDHIEDVFARQVEEPQKEKDLKSNIPTIKGKTDNVSSKVRKQYEENPYPRWINMGIRLEPAPLLKIIDEIKLKLHFNKINQTEKPNILIAGCGTGQHSIETATRFKSSKVLAIDLSLSSLAYAKRKTDELGIKNIEYMQADILNLGQLNKQFDIIESAGVLHHMDNPMTGWKVLTNRLKPAGLMKIGLYSELARQNIVKIRSEISQLGIGSSSIEMKSFRDMIIRSDKNHHKLIVNFPDFYSLSDLRDLLFHAQEHRFTIPLLKDYLEKLGLHFCGFESEEVVSKFKITNAQPDDLYDLNKWRLFEEANPTAFYGMYQFWCQKII